MKSYVKHLHGLFALLVGFAMICISLTSNSTCHAQEAGSVDAKIHFGSKPLMKVAVPYAPEFFAKFGERTRFGMAISDDGQECYYAVAFNEGNQFREEIRFTRFEDGAWTAPKPLLSEKEYKYVDPHFSPDGNRLYFIYTKPVKNDVAPKNPAFDIWFVNRKDGGWSAPVNVGAPVSSIEAHEYYVSLTSEGTLYFGSNRADPKNFELYSARQKDDGSYHSPELLPGHVNTSKYEADVFVAPDESYIIFSSNQRDDGHGRGDLYVSFRGDDGKWAEAVNMGANVNSKSNEFAPSVSRDGKHLFFSRGGVIHWVDASVIEDLRPQKEK